MTHRRRQRRLSGDAGNGVVEFTLVTVLLLGMFLLIVQVGLVLHTRNVLVAAAAEGARYGANADRTAEQGAERARAVASDSLGGMAGDNVTAAAGPAPAASGPRVVEIVVHSELPVLFVPGGFGLTVRGHAVKEGVG